jgi:hypothetical protein
VEYSGAFDSWALKPGLGNIASASFTFWHFLWGALFLFFILRLFVEGYMYNHT